MLRAFQKDPFYLAHYHTKVVFVLAFINTGLLIMRPPEWHDVILYMPALYLATSSKLKHVVGAFAYAFAASVFSADFSLMALFIGVPAALVFTFPFSALIHSASHGSIRPRWLNRPVGELMGVIQLSGFPDWKITHVLHHTHTDHPELDPHPPLKKTYWEFALGMRDSVMKAYLKYYFKVFGQNDKSMQALNRFKWASLAAVSMKLTFWFLVLKPQFFAFFFLTSVAFKMTHWAWFNYSTHRPVENGVQIHNLTKYGYKFVNLIGFGLYYHDNHHASPMLFNPKYKPDSSLKEKTNSQAA